jgi:hypothetical protein
VSAAADLSYAFPAIGKLWEQETGAVEDELEAVSYDENMRN